MKKISKILALVVVLLLGFAVVLTACDPTTTTPPEDVYTPGDFATVWNTIGSQVGIEDVEHETGSHQAFVTVDGVKYELGMDFLSMAMVYSTTVTNESKAKGFDTEEKIYNEWWKLYMLRWNYLLPELPIYSNEYYDVYNAQKIKTGTLNTAPYWGAADAILGVEKAESESTDKIILGNSTTLSGRFRVASYGLTSPGAADLDIQSLTSGYGTVVTDETGAYNWADTSIVAEHSEQNNEDGSKTFTIKIAEGLKFSDGSPIKAANYLVGVLATSTNVYAASHSNASNQGGMTYVGWEDFSEFEGTGNQVVFSGIRLLDEYTFSVTVDPEWLPYYYDITYAAFSPVHFSLYLPSDAEIKDDGQGCYIDSETFYATGTVNGLETFTWASTINSNMFETDATKIPYSGPYVVDSWNETAFSATLKANTNFAGDNRGKAVFGTLAYERIISATQVQQLQTGAVDVLMGVTGDDDTNAALNLVNGSSGQFAENHYGRAGYGKLQFRSDFGPTQFVEVRQAIAYSIDRNAFATAFTGGHGVAVHGPYFPEMNAYVANQTELDAGLNKYAVSQESAIQVLQEGGWVYNADGSAYVEGSGNVRYKKLAKEEQTEFNLNFHSQNNQYKTTMVTEEDGSHTFYMPLVINWYGTSDNTFSDLLITNWAGAQMTKNIGMVVQYTLGEFAPMLDEFTQGGYGVSFRGDAVYGAFNFATGFTSTIYDYAYNWCPEEPYYTYYSVAYLKDAADIIWLD